MIMREIVRAYLEARRKAGTKTADELASLWARVCDRELGKLDASELTVPRLTRFIEKLRSGRFPSQAGKAKILISAALRWARAHLDSCAELGFLPTQAVTVPRGKPRAVTLSPEQIGRVLRYLTAEPSDPVSLALVLYFATAARCSELTALRRSEVACDGDSIEISLPQTKNGDPHTLYLFGRFAQLLGAHLQTLGDGPKARVFASPYMDGRPVSRVTVLNRWRSVQSDLGLSGFTVHDIRRSSATLLANSGETLENVELLLNHRHLTPIQAAYYHVHAQRLRPIFARLQSILGGLIDSASDVSEAPSK